ncbi:MAG: hypothetical protein IT181_00475, partial [Acidobacteria bacterium]|nr:hypothetical protein [Acidobacteriota bacterium]
MSPLKLSGVTVRCALLLVSALVATPWAARPAEAQAVTFLQKLLVPGGPGGSRFGAVAVDGTTAVVGASGESARQGAVYVYVRSGNTWTQRQRLVASDGQPFDEFGTDVGLSGNTLIVGAPKAAANAGGQQGQGAAYVFGWNGTAWVQQARLVATDPRASAFFGTHVSIDGNTVVAGAPFFGLPAATGATYVFERSGNTWVGSKLAVPDAGSNDHFGGAVSVSGTTLCVGAPLDTEGVNINPGSVYVYTRGGSGWSLQQKLLAPGGTGDDFFGQSCAIDGDTLVGGADSDDAPLSGQGSAYVFVRAGGTWTFEQQLLASDPGINDQFGFSAAIFGDTVVVGAQGHN